MQTLYTVGLELVYILHGLQFQSYLGVHLGVLELNGLIRKILQCMYKN